MNKIIREENGHTKKSELINKMNKISDVHGHLRFTYLSKYHVLDNIKES